MNKEIIVNVIGAGLAGSEAAYQLIKRGIKNEVVVMADNKNEAFKYMMQNADFAGNAWKSVLLVHC